MTGEILYVDGGLDAIGVPAPEDWASGKEDPVARLGRRDSRATGTRACVRLSHSLIQEEMVPADRGPCSGAADADSICDE